MNSATTSIILDKRFQRKDGTYSIKLRVTFEREQKYYPLHIALSPEDWDKVQSPKPRNEFKEYLLYFNKVEQKAAEIIEKLDPFSFQLFERNFDKKAKKGSKDVLNHLSDYIDNLREKEQIGTATSYGNALSSLRKFSHSKNRKKLNFSDITPEWLYTYEKWMLEDGKTLTTVGIYLRCVRHIFNMAIDDEIITKDIYPFGKRKYQIPAGRNVKKALTLANIKEIVNYIPETPAEEKARDLWLFSYLCNGANIKDIARLKYKNIDREKITFIRAKTERTTRNNLKPIIAVLIPEIKEIIQRWGVQTQEPDAYVFDILSQGDSAELERNKVKQAIKTINKYMKRIGTKLGIDTKLTTYTARHSFATVLKRSGASIEFIGESLGHKDLRTTENYLDSFEHSVRAEYQKKLLDFD